MRHIRMIGVILFLLMLAVPALAQDAGTTAETTNHLVMILLASLLVATLFFGGYLMQFLARLVPPEVAAGIYDSGVKVGIQMALNRAAQTETKTDDEFFVALAKQHGYTATLNAAGVYDLQKIEKA